MQEGCCCRIVSRAECYSRRSPFISVLRNGEEQCASGLVYSRGKNDKYSHSRITHLIEGCVAIAPLRNTREVRMTNTLEWCG